MSSSEKKSNKNVDYKKLYENEKKKNQNLNKIIEEKNKEINKLNTIIKLKNSEIDESKKKILSYINSNTAKNGFKEEDILCNDLNKNKEIQDIFSSILGKNYNDFSRIVDNNKCDIYSNIKNIRAQVKRYKHGQFQQLDRHWIDDMVKSIPEIKEISNILKNLCEYPLLPNKTHIDKKKSIKKLCETNYSISILDNLINVLNNNKIKILNYAFFGINKKIEPEYLFGIEYINNERKKIVLFKIKEIIAYLETLDFKISKRKTVIVLGDESIISLQRKGGDGGKKSSNQLQIKIILSRLIDKVNNLQYIF